MQSELVFPVSVLYSFLLVLVRIGGVIVFVPFPGLLNSPSIARAALAICCTIALFSRWPQVSGDIPISTLIAWILPEAAMGILAGVSVSFIAEAFVMGAQILSLQAGYGYASTIDPATQADSGILQIIAQLFAGLLFFCFGLDRQVFQIFARSLEVYPPGTFSLTRPMATELIRLGSNIFSVGLRLALPVVGLLLMVDLALALIGRLNAHVQVTTISFPIKMLLTLAFLAALVSLWPSIYKGLAGTSFDVVKRFLLAR